ncbi:MAG: imidazolonepropionase [Bacillota bacterium]
MGKTTAIINIGELVTCAGGAKFGLAMNDIGIINDAAVIVEDGIILSVGTMVELGDRANLCDQIIDVDGMGVLPGFVDSHTHFIFGGYREDEFEWRLNGESYMSIMERGGGIANSVRATRVATAEQLLKVGRERLATMLAYGVTTVEGKSGYGLDVDTELRQLAVMRELNSTQPLEIAITYMGAHSVPLECKVNPEKYITLVIDEALPKAVEYAEFCDVFCEKNVFSVDQSRRILLAGQKLGLKSKLHADEIVQLGGAELAAELGAVSADHLLNASDAGLVAMARSETVCTLLPATAFSLREPYARARYMIDNGACVALASDFNPGSCCTASIPLVIALAALNMQMTNAEIVTALTINGAKAINRNNIIGSIEPGKQADLLVLKYPSHKFISYRIAENIVKYVIKKGVIVNTST